MYSPKENCRLDDIDNYQLIVSESYVPNWFCGDVAETANGKSSKKLSNL
jgi:hypothetical protein